MNIFIQKFKLVFYLGNHRDSIGVAKKMTPFDVNVFSLKTNCCEFCFGYRVQNKYLKCIYLGPSYI